MDGRIPVEDAVVTVMADRSRPGVHRRLVESAAGVLGTDHVSLVHWDPEHHGWDWRLAHDSPAETPVAVVDPPQEEPSLLRVLADRTPLRWGEPGTPASGTRFIAAPVVVGGQSYAVLSAAAPSRSEGFGPADESQLGLLARAGGTAIDHALLREEAGRRGRWLAGASAVTSAILAGASDADAFDVIASRVRELADADQAWITLLLPGEELMEIRAVSGGLAGVAVGNRVPLAGSLSEAVVRSGRSTALDLVTGRDVRTDGVRRHVVGFSRTIGNAITQSFPGAGGVVIAPLRTGYATEGVIVLVWTVGNMSAFRRLDLEIVESFAEQATLAAQLSHGREDRERLAIAEDHERISRDLHDVVIQRLFATGLAVERLSRKANEPAVADRLDAAVDDIDAAIAELRNSISELTTRSEQQRTTARWDQSPTAPGRQTPPDGPERALP